MNEAVRSTGAAGILYLDSSALLRRFIADQQRPFVLGAMADADHWVSSGLSRSELQLALVHAAATPFERDRLWDAVRRDWDALWEVPVDARCLVRATEIGATYGVTTVDAIHLAAADRLGRPVRYLTFERQQIPAAAELGFDVLAPLG